MQDGRRRAIRAPRLIFFSLIAAGLCNTGCDIPTGGPDFSFTPSASAPIVFEKTFVFLGPDSSGVDGLIDTTSATFDSIFTVDPVNGGVYIAQDLEAFDLIDIENVLDPMSFEPEDLVVTIGSLASQHVVTSYEDSIGVLEIAGAQVSDLVPDVTTDRAYLPITAGALLTVPTNGVIDLTGARVEAVRVTGNQQAGLNRIRFTLENGLGAELTDGSSSPGAPPAIVLESAAGTEIARALFGRSLSPGQSASAVLMLSGLEIPADGRFALDVSTPSGFAPVAAEPWKVITSADMAPVRYSGFDMSDIPATTARASRTNLRLETDVDLAGVTTRVGYASVEITNTLPLPLQIESLTVTNVSPVASYPPGHHVVDHSGSVIPAASTVAVPVFIGANALSRAVDVEVVATTSPTDAPTDFEAGDGLAVAVTGDVEIDVLFYRPGGEVFTTSTAFEISQGNLTFASAADYAEVRSGSLQVIDLLNGLDLSFDNVTISFPDIRFAPYGPEDTLVVAFRGTSDKSNGREFAKIDRNEPPRSVSVDLRGARISPIGGQVRYHVAARSESAPDVRAVTFDDRISGRAATSALELGQVAALADPFSAFLTEDINGDGVLDPGTAGEAATNTVDDFGPLDEVSGLELVGAELSVNLTTAMSGDLVLYGILVGEDDSGNTIYMEGRGPLAVSPADSVLQSFRINGSPARPDQMFALPAVMVGSPDRISVNTLVLNETNSNINDFVNARPTTLRFVGKALIGSPGGRIELSQPASVDVSVGIAVPLNVRGDFEVERTESANLSALGELTNPESAFSTEAATLTLVYANEIPLGLRARLEFVDAAGSGTVALPLADGETIYIMPAPTDANGYGVGESTGEAEFGLADEALRRLADSDDLRIVLTFEAPAQTSGRIRASDRLNLALRGEFRFNVTIGE